MTMRKKLFSRRFMALTMSVMMMLSLCTTAFAEEADPGENENFTACETTEGCVLENGHEGECKMPQPADVTDETDAAENAECTKNDTCTAKTHAEECPFYVIPENTDMPDGTKDVNTEDNTDETNPEEEVSAVSKVQELIDALPEEVTGENAEAVEAQLSAIDEAKAVLTDEELEGLVFDKYIAAANALGSFFEAQTLENAVAQIGTGNEAKSYEAFAEAYAAAVDGDIITLLKDADWTASGVSLSVTKKITIDLNGYTLSLAREGKTTGFYLEIKAQGELTIKDSGTDGKLITPASTYAVRANGGDLKLEGGTLEAPNGTRTVSLSNAASTFTMTGGSLVNGKADEGKGNSNVLEVSTGTAVISGGTLQSTNSDDPVPCAKVSKTGSLTISGNTKLLTEADRAVWNSDKGTLNVSGGDFSECTGGAVCATNAGTTVISADIPSLLLNNQGVVTVEEDVRVGSVSAMPDSSGSTAYTFKLANRFGGSYGNDFTANIAGNGLECVKAADGDDYTVEAMNEDDEKIVATITHSDGTKSLFGDFAAAASALQNGDTLILKKDVVNASATSYSITASNVTIDLNGHSISANEATSGLRFYPRSDNISEGDTVKLTGTGTITGNSRGVSCETNGADMEAPVYTLSVGSGVQLSAQETDGSPVNLNAVQARMSMETAPADYAAVTGGGALTVLDGKTYVYASPVRAVNDQPASGGTVELLGDCTVTATKGVNEAVNAGAVVLDLKGYTMTLQGQQGLLANGSDLTIRNGTLAHTVTTTEQKYAYALGVLNGEQNNSSLTLKSVTIEEGSDYATAFTVNGSMEGTKVSMEDCVISCTGTGSTVGIYFPVNNGTLDITNTKITAMNAVQVKGGTTTISGDGTEITSTGPKNTPEATSGCTNTGDGVYVEDTYGFNPVVYFKGGTVKSENSEALNYFDNEQDNATGKIEASKGTFSSDVKDYVAKGNASIPNGNDTWSIGINKEEAVAEADGVGYATLEEALDNAPEGATVTLLQPYALEKCYQLTKSVTIDLGGNTLMGTEDGYLFEIRDEGLNVEVKNGEMNGYRGFYCSDGSLTLTDAKLTTSERSIANAGASTVTVGSGSVVTSTDYAAIVTWGEGQGETAKSPTLHVYGTVTTEARTYAAITGNGTDRSNTTIHVYEGALVQAKSTAIYHPQPGTLNISGGKITGYCGIGMKSGVLNITGGTVEGTANDNVLSDEHSRSNGIVTDGSAIVIDSNTAYAGEMKISVSGDAKIISHYSTAIREINNREDGTNVVSLEISGGTITGGKDMQAVMMKEATAERVFISGGTFSSEVPEEYCADNFHPNKVTNADGSVAYSVHTHEFTWVVDKEATATEKGSKHEECTVCGYRKEAVEIPILEDDKEDDDKKDDDKKDDDKKDEDKKDDSKKPGGTDSGSDNGNRGSADQYEGTVTASNTGAASQTNSAGTGDESAPALWGALLLLGAAGLSGLILARRRNRSVK